MAATPPDDAEEADPAPDGAPSSRDGSRAPRRPRSSTGRGGPTDRGDPAAPVQYAPRPPGYSARLTRRLAMVLVCGLGTALVAHAALSTRWGQAVDTMLMESTMTWNGALGSLEGAVRGVISAPGLVVVSVFVAVVAILRRRPTLAGRALVMVAGANATTQLLQHVLSRPDLGITTVVQNSLPSGHTTVAASVAAALVIVAPAWFREPAAWAGWAWTALTGVTVMVSAWHRPSDVIAALLVTGAWALALAPLEQRERHAVGAQRAMGWIALGCVALGILGALAATAGLDLAAIAAPGGGLGNYGFAEFVAEAGWRTRMMAVSASLMVVGVIGLVLHEVDRLSWG